MDYMIDSVPVQRMQATASVPATSKAHGLYGFQDELQRQMNSGEGQGGLSSAAPSSPEGAGPGLIRVGTISREAPTVSHLLISHPDYAGDCWKIIHSEVNTQKPFRTLREGQEIFIDPATHEVVWDRGGASLAQAPAPNRDVLSESVPVKSLAAREHTPSEPVLDAAPVMARADDSGSGSLATVVSQHIGTPYEKLNCYELVVEGLKEMGVRYSGKGGLQAHLINEAVDQGLPMNAYLTGNGLIQASSTPVFDRTVTERGGAKARVADIWKDLEPVLEQGLIVSFSTGSRGHTGVVSQYRDTWTFLNSGDIDNDVRSKVRRKGVGEEDLKSEISNWLRRARETGAPLRIALGRLDSEKLASFQGGRSVTRTA